MSAKIMIPLKQWKFEAAERLGITVRGVDNRIYRTHELHPKLVRKNQRVVLVEVKQGEHL